MIANNTIQLLTDALGEKKVLTSDGSLNAAAHDTWPVSTKESMIDRHDHRPDVVVMAKEVADIERTLQIAADTDTPVTTRALASSVTGQPLPTQGGIVLDVSAIPASYEVNERDMTVTATASYMGGKLEDELQEQGYTMGHSPQSLYRSTVGGWVSTLAIGQFSSLYGGIEDLVCSYDLILATGEHITVGQHPRAAMGPDMRKLFCGAEGTLGVVTSVTLKIFPLPPVRLNEAFLLPDVDAGIEAMRDFTLAGLKPYLVRFYDPEEAMAAAPTIADGRPVMFIGTQGVETIAQAEKDEMVRIITAHGGESAGEKPVTHWMNNRFDFSGVENLLAKTGGYAETIEVAHMWSGIKPLYADLKKALAPFADVVMVHFSHIYTQGTSMYVILKGQTDSDEKAVEILKQVWSTTMEVCVEHGAELSHHHGGGLARSPYSRRSLGTAHKVLRRIKHAMDPNGLLNPGKLGL